MILKKSVNKKSHRDQYSTEVCELFRKLTWQCRSHRSPLQPGAQVQWPSRALQAPSFPHTQVRLQPSPHVPLGQFIEQCTPCQPV